MKASEKAIYIALCVKNNILSWYNISLELRVKEKLLRYPEELFFDSQGIPAKLLSSYPIMLVLG